MAISSEELRLGWIGLGNMGLAMAKNLQIHMNTTGQPALHYTNRTMATGEPLRALGGIPCESISNLMNIIDVAFCSVSDDAVLKEVVNQITVSDFSEGKIFVDTSTVAPSTTAAMALELSKANATFISAPVFGATPVAERGELLMAIAGPSSIIEIVRPLLVGIIVREIISVGEDVIKASLLKTAGNFITAGLAELVSEAHVFAEKTGLGSEALETLIKEKYGTYTYGISRKLTTGVYAPPKNKKAASAVELAIKDVGHGITAAKTAGVQLQIGNMSLGHLKEAKAYSENRGDRPLDSSSVHGVIRQHAGLDFETEFVKNRDM